MQLVYLIKKNVHLNSMTINNLNVFIHVLLDTLLTNKNMSAQPVKVNIIWVVNFAILKNVFNAKIHILNLSIKHAYKNALMDLYLMINLCNVICAVHYYKLIIVSVVMKLLVINAKVECF